MGREKQCRNLLCSTPKREKKNPHEPSAFVKKGTVPSRGDTKKSRPRLKRLLALTEIPRKRFFVVKETPRQNEKGEKGFQ